MATDRLGDMRLFVEAAALGSLSAAGRKLALSPAAASARLIKLEAALRTKLFDRTTRQLRLTEEGRFYLQQCWVALRAIDEAEAGLQASQTEVRGKVRISASADFGRNLLNDWLEAFSTLHPELYVALTLSDSVSNLVQDDVEHAHFVAVFFAEQGHGAVLDGVVKRHVLGPGLVVLQDLAVDDGFHLGDLLGRDGGVVAEVETGLVGIDQRTLLRHVAAQHFAQGLVHQVGGRVVADGAAALVFVDPGIDLVADLERAFGQHAVVAEHVGLDFEGVFHLEQTASAAQHALVAHLAAGLGVEGGRVEHGDAVVARLQFLHLHAIAVQGDDGGVVHQRVVADEFGLGAAVFHAGRHLEFAGGAGRFLLLLHGGIEAGFIDGHAALAADVGRQVQREAVGVVQGEGGGAVELVAALGQLGFQDFHAVFQGLAETLFFLADGLGDAGLGFRQLGIGGAHLDVEVFHQFIEEGLALAQHVAVAQGAADDAAQDVAMAFGAGNDAVDDQKGSGADVVSDHAQRFAFQVGRTGLAGSGLDQSLEQVDLVVAVHVLQHRGQALQAHARVDTGLGQLVHHARFVAVELHEHQVPDFDKAVAVFVGRAWRATGNVGAVVVENFRAGTARADVGHLPEVVGGVAGTLVVADADDALGRHADFLGPDIVGFVVLEIDGDGELVGWQAVDLGQQLPGIENRIALEIVAEAEVAQHLEEGVVAGRVAHVFQVVVLAARAHAALHRGRARVGARVGADEDVLELHHAAVGEQHGRIIARHEGAGTDDRVALRGKEAEEFFANFR